MTNPSNDPMPDPVEPISPNEIQSHAHRIGQMPDLWQTTCGDRTPVSPPNEIPASNLLVPPPELTASSERPCPACGELQTTVPIPQRGGYRWRICSCQDARIAAYEARIKERQAWYEETRTTAYAAVRGSTPLTHFRDCQLGQFVRAWVTHAPADPHPVDYLWDWLHRIQSYGPRADYRDPQCPPVVQYLYSPVRGCGKTHLAMGVGQEVARTHHVVCLEDPDFVTAYWTCPMDRRPQLVEYPGQAFLTIIDDLGRRAVRRPSGTDSTSTADVWDTVLESRYRRGGWTIITSNYLPDELVDRGTLNASINDRLLGMLHDGYLLIDGPSRRGTLHQIDAEVTDDPSTS